MGEEEEDGLNAIAFSSAIRVPAGCRGIMVEEVDDGPAAFGLVEGVLAVASCFNCNCCCCC